MPHIQIHINTPHNATRSLAKYIGKQIKQVTKTAVQHVAKVIFLI